MLPCNDLHGVAHLQNGARRVRPGPRFGPDGALCEVHPFGPPHGLGVALDPQQRPIDVADREDMPVVSGAGSQQTPGTAEAPRRADGLAGRKPAPRHCGSAPADRCRRVVRHRRRTAATSRPPVAARCRRCVVRRRHEPLVRGAQRGRRGGVGSVHGTSRVPSCRTAPQPSPTRDKEPQRPIGPCGGDCWNSVLVEARSRPFTGARVTAGGRACDGGGRRAVRP